MNNVIFTKVEMFRNLKDFKFVPKLTEENKAEILSRVENLFKDSLTLVDLSLDGGMISYLKENKLAKNLNSKIFLSKSDKLSVEMFNSEHLTICGTSENFDVAIFKKVKALSDKVSNNLSLAFSDEYGFLMSDLSKIGAGIHIECDICLNSIRTLGKIEQVKQNIRKLGYNLKETKIQNIYSLSTICNLGFSEKEIFDEFKKMVEKLEDLEIESAKMQDITSHDEVLDKINRSLAILKSAHLMSYEELFQLIINLRTGLNLGQISLSNKTINKLQNLVINKNSDFSSQSEHKILAEKVKNILKGEENV